MIGGGNSTVMSRMTTRRFSPDGAVPVAADGRAGSRHALAHHILVPSARRDRVLTLQAPGGSGARRERPAPRRDAAAQVKDLFPASARARPPAGARAP